MSIDISLEVNGTTHQLSVEPTETMIDVLRHRPVYTSAEAAEVRGACEAALAGLAGEGAVIEAVEDSEWEAAASSPLPWFGSSCSIIPALQGGS